MSSRPVGVCSDLSAAAATAFHRVELNPTRTIHCREFSVSLNAAPNSTAAPVEWNLQRSTTVGTGAAGTVVNVNDDISEALTTTALVENTADGTLADVVWRDFVPNVSGYTWVAAPGIEIDCIAAEFLSLINISALPASVNACTRIVWEE